MVTGNEKWPISLCHCLIIVRMLRNWNSFRNRNLKGYFKHAYFHNRNTFFSKSIVLTLNHKNQISVRFGDDAEDKQNSVMMVSKALVGSNGCLYFHRQNPFNTWDSSAHPHFWCVISLPWVFLKFFIWIVLCHELICLLTVYFYGFFDWAILNYINYLVALSP